VGEITELLSRSAAGDGAAMDAVFQRVYPELRRLARAQIGRGQHTLTPTALVHEAYLRLLGAAALPLQDRRHFFACAARAMRNILIDRLRASTADKRGGGLDPVTLDDVDIAGPGVAGADFAGTGLGLALLDLDEALDALDQLSPRQREVVELHFFAGLTYQEIAELHECSERTVIREWQRARAFLHAQLGDVES
jgi:RNA polymerase sigma factor (TIGR02999 family)